MIPLTSKLPLTAIRRFAHDWFRLLAQGEFVQAAAALDKPTSYGQRWSAESIRDVLRNYSPNATVTPLRSFRPIGIRASSPFPTAVVTHSIVQFRSMVNGVISPRSSNSFIALPASSSSSKISTFFDSLLNNRDSFLRRFSSAMNITSLSEDDYYEHLERPHHPPNAEMPRDAFDEEYYQLFDRVAAIMSEHGENNAYGEGDYCLEPRISESRGLGFEVTNPAIITEPLLQRLQTLLAQHAPDWELFLGSSNFDYGIFIGPASIGMHRHDKVLPQLNDFVSDVA